MAEQDAKDRRIAELEAEVAELKEQVRQLLAKLGRNSLNSSLPPSRDNAEARNKRPRKRKSRRKRGGQKGHKRSERKLLPPEQVDEFIIVIPTHCATCDARLSGKDPNPARRQLTDIPPPQVHVTEAQCHALGCSKCGTITQAPWPEQFEHGAFGPRLWAMVCLLTGAYRMSKRNVQDLLGDAFGIDIALGTVSKLEARGSEALADGHRQVREHIRREPAVNMDETSWTEGQDSAWLWVASTPEASYFQIAPDRGSNVVVSILGEDFGGIVCSDRAKAYLVVTPDSRQACWFHLGRNFQSKVELGGTAAIFGKQMRAFEKRLFKAEHQRDAGKIDDQSYARRMKLLRGEVHHALEGWAKHDVDGIAGMCKGLLDIEPALWTFVDNPTVSPTNNRAERDIRHPVIWRRSSFGTDSPKGSRYVERILTVVQTCKKQGRRAFEFLTDLFSAVVHEQPLPRLILDSS